MCDIGPEAKRPPISDDSKRSLVDWSPLNFLTSDFTESWGTKSVEVTSELSQATSLLIGRDILETSNSGEVGRGVPLQENPSGSPLASNRAGRSCSKAC